MSSLGLCIWQMWIIIGVGHRIWNLWTSSSPVAGFSALKHLLHQISPSTLIRCCSEALGVNILDNHGFWGFPQWPPQFFTFATPSSFPSCMPLMVSTKQVFSMSPTAHWISLNHSLAKLDVASFHYVVSSWEIGVCMVIPTLQWRVMFKQVFYPQRSSHWGRRPHGGCLSVFLEP